MELSGVKISLETERKSRQDGKEQVECDAATKRNAQSHHKPQLTNDPAWTESPGGQDRVEAVLHKSSKELATVILLMPPIVMNSEMRVCSVKTKERSFSTLSLSTQDSDDGTIDGSLDEIEEELIGLQLLPKDE